MRWASGALCCLTLGAQLLAGCAGEVSGGVPPSASGAVLPDPPGAMPLSGGGAGPFVPNVAPEPSTLAVPMVPGTPGTAVPEPGAETPLPRPSVPPEAPLTREEQYRSLVVSTALEYAAPVLDDTPLPARTWKLTHAQYQRAVQQLIGKEADTSNFIPATSGGMFSNYSATGLVREDLAANYFDTAKLLASELTETELRDLTSCDLTAACASSFVGELGERAFRRPLRAEEVTTYSELFDVGAAGGQLVGGFRAVVQGLLNSPNFLYRTELGAEEEGPQGDFSLTSYEIASLLSFSVLGSPPSTELLAAAADGRLRQAEGLRSQLEGLLGVTAADEQLGHFIQEWLEVGHFSEVEKFDDAFPGFADAQGDMWQETLGFLAQHASTGSGFQDLLLRPVESSEALLDFYRSDPSANPEVGRFGILGLGSVLSHHAKAYLTSPTLRGTFIRKRFFCMEIDLPEGFTPPPLSDTEKLGEATTTRQLYERHQEQPTCEACHRLTDYIGFSLEGFDGAGRWRTRDITQGADAVIDSESVLTHSDVNRSISNHLDLAQALSESELVRECLARQAFRFYLGQAESSSGQAPVMAARQALSDGGDLGEMLQALLGTPASWERRR